MAVTVTVRTMGTMSVRGLKRGESRGRRDKESRRGCESMNL